MDRRDRIALGRFRPARRTFAEPPAAPPEETSPSSTGGVSAEEFLYALLNQSDEGPDYNCDEGRHEPHAVLVATAPEPLGYYCARCRVTCDANGAEIE